MTELPAGPELDAAIAEQVMGWTKSKEFWGFHRGYGRPSLPIWEPKCRCEDWTPSTDIAAAWAVVERVNALGFTVKVMRENCAGVRYDCTTDTPLGDLCVNVTADTAPLAICRAALAHVAKCPTIAEELDKAVGES